MSAEKQKSKSIPAISAITQLSELMRSDWQPNLLAFGASDWWIVKMWAHKGRNVGPFQWQYKDTMMQI